MESCDTFVALSDVTKCGNVIFGKNSDRPYGEIQEVVRNPSQKYARGSKVKVAMYKIVVAVALGIAKVKGKMFKENQQLFTFLLGFLLFLVNRLLIFAFAL